MQAARHTARFFLFSHLVAASAGTPLHDVPTGTGAAATHGNFWPTSSRIKKIIPRARSKGR